MEVFRFSTIHPSALALRAVTDGGQREVTEGVNDGVNDGGH